MLVILIVVSDSGEAQVTKEVSKEKLGIPKLWELIQLLQADNVST